MTITDNGQTASGDIADGAITNPKLDADAVTTDKVLNETLLPEDIGDIGQGYLLTGDGSGPINLLAPGADGLSLVTDSLQPLGVKWAAAAPASHTHLVADITDFDPTDYLLLAGGTMLGTLVLSGAPTADLHAATKKYVDDGLALKEDTLGFTPENVANKGIAGGYASLDGSGKLPTSQLTVSAMEYKGVWDASLNSPALADGVGNTGDLYRISVGGTQDLGSGSITFNVGDSVLYNGATWEKLDNTDAVISVAGKTGAVTLVEADITDLQNYSLVGHTHVVADITDFTPSDYLPLAGGTMTGTLTLNADPTLNLEAATKQYVDANAGAQAFNDLTDGNLTAPADGQILRYEAVPGEIQNSTAIYAPDAGTLEVGQNTATNLFTRINQGGLEIRKADEAQHRFRILNDGDIQWQRGTDGANDASISFNSATGRLDLAAAGEIYSSAQIELSGGKSFRVASGTGGGFIHAGTDVAGRIWLQSKVAADVQQRFQVQGDGTIKLGGGAVAPDWELAWSAANTATLAAGDQLQVQQDPVAANDLSRKQYVDDGLSGKSNTGHTHTLSEITDAGTAAASAATDFVAVTGDAMTGALTTTSTMTVNQGLGTTREIQIGKVFGGNVLIDFGNNLSAYIRKGSGNTLVTGPGAWLIEGPGGGALQLTNTAFGTGFYIGGDIAAGLKRSAVGVLQTTGKIQSTQAPTVGDDLTNKTYVDGGLSGKTDTGHTHTLSDITDAGTAAASAATDFVAVTGDTMTGNLIVGASGIRVETGGLIFGYGEATIDFRNHAGPNTTAIRLGVTGDNPTYERFGIRVGGRLQWGDGAGPTDVYLERTAANVIAMGAGDKIQQNAAPTVGDDLTNKTYVDSKTSSFNFFESAESETVSTTTATTFQTKISHVTATLVSGAKYKVSAVASIGATPKARAAEVQLAVTGAAISKTRSKVCYGGPNDNSAELQSYAEAFVLTAASAATATIALEYRQPSGVGTAQIEDAIVMIERIS